MDRKKYPIVMTKPELAAEGFIHLERDVWGKITDHEDWIYTYTRDGLYILNMISRY